MRLFIKNSYFLILMNYLNLFTDFFINFLIYQKKFCHSLHNCLNYEIYHPLLLLSSFKNQNQYLSIVFI